VRSVIEERVILMFRKLMLLLVSTFLFLAGLAPVHADEPFTVTFEDGDTSFVKVDFGAAQSSTIVSGFDSNSTKVLKVTRGTPSWAGTTIVNSPTKILLKQGTLTASAKIYSPKAGVKLMLKIENRVVPANSIESYATKDSVLGWSDYTFDFTVPRQGTAPFNAGFTYNMASLFLDYTLSDGAVTTAGQVFYVDDVVFPSATGGGGGGQPVVATETLLTYESGDTLGALNAALATGEHPQGIFGGGSALIHADPPSGAFGTKALAITKTGAPWTGLNALVDTTGLVRYTNAQHSKVTFNFYSPKSDSPLAVQLFSGGSYVELKKVAKQGWSTQSFDFADVNGWSANVIYDKVVIFPDFQVEVSNPADVYYVDDVAVNGAVTPVIEDVTPPPPPPADVKPSVTLAALLTAKNTKVGTVLSVSKGAWAGTAPITYKYTWYRCTNKASTASTAKPATAAKCLVIAGKTSSIYRLVSADKGKYIRAMITATNVAGTSYSTTKSTVTKVG